MNDPVKYTEICALYHFCVDLGIKCTIERLYDGYAVRFSALFVAKNGVLRRTMT